EDGHEGTEAIAPGTTPVEVQVDAAGLEPNKTYEVTLVTRNDGGGEVTSLPTTYTTSRDAPLVTTIRAFPLEGATSALVGGRVNPLNAGTSWWVEYGPSAAYGQSTQPAEVGSGGSGVLVREKIAGLTPGATYHFRLFAENSSHEKSE